MALNRAAQEKLLKTLKYSEEDIKRLLDDNKDIELTIPETIRIYSPEDIKEFESNIRRGYVKEDAAIEIWCRKMNKEYALNLTGDAAKDPTKIQEAMKAKWVAENGLSETESAKRFKELQESFTAKEMELNGAQKHIAMFETEKKYRKLFFESMAKTLDEEEWIARLQRTFDIRKEGDVEGLFDIANGKFIMDDKKNILPFQTAFATIIETERFKGWHEPVVVPEVVKRATHAPGHNNPANARIFKYKTNEEIMAEINKKYPPERKGEKDWNKNRMKYMQELRGMTV